MTRIVLALVVAAIAVYVIMRIAQGQSPSVAKSSLPALDPADIQEAAAIAYGPDRGYGILRLTPSQLVFAANSGRVLTIERLDITGATVTKNLPDRESAQPMLAVSTRDAMYYFSVNDPLAWELRLL
ncbi:MAG: hypothetical protein U0R27_06670 [Candidatus Nanopelagicales bacterium]|nr:hypothetical protein [Actinomycetota bacterium]HNE89288.1 hypothetical protein [Actinomycetota bacterium]HNL51116.1 hypothetical protein [Actinomycetota bacterium]HUM86764.1 hypothetical protein [Actinomycetota bacterium]